MCAFLRLWTQQTSLKKVKHAIWGSWISAPTKSVSSQIKKKERHSHVREDTGCVKILCESFVEADLSFHRVKQSIITPKRS
jgi:hypothetical protein